MRKIFIYSGLSLMLLSCSTKPKQDPAVEWQNPEIIAINKEKPHANLFYNLLNETPENVQLLNGDWKFKFAVNPYEAPENFQDSAYDDSAWGTLPVPSNWQIYGHGVAIYRNITHPFPCTPPLVPADKNETGCYRRTFEVPQNWNGQKIVLHFDGAQSAMYVWVNGKQAGYTEDSMLPSEFDITSLVQPGNNVVACKVINWSDGSYLEDQDFYRTAGIHRDVYVYALPQQHMYDFYVTTDFDAQYRDAQFNLNVKTNNITTTGYKVKVEVLDDNNNSIINK